MCIRDRSEPAAASPADTAAIPVQGEPTPDWVPYTTAPATDPTFGSQPTPPAGASYDAPYVPPAVSAAPGPVPPAPGQGSYQQPQQPPQPQQPYGGYAAPYGQTPHAGPGAVPPQQPYYGYQQPYYQQPYQQPVIATKAVSYTHLDVYKRQITSRFRSQRAGRLLFRHPAVAQRFCATLLPRGPERAAPAGAPDGRSIGYGHT